METVELRNERMTARIAAFGAELRTLALDGADFLWRPDAGIWDGTCPVLFPVIGRVNDDVVRIGGTAYSMPMHGFALTSLFSVVEQTVEHCTLELRASPETRQDYPYDFTLRMSYRLSDSALQITAEIRNDGQITLPASLGLHPGFRWPLVPGVPKGRHLLTFDEAAPIHYTRPIDRLIGPDRFELLLEGKSVRLAEALFEKGGLALLSLKSRSLRFHTEDGNAAVRVDFPEMDGIILWSRPGGDFLCIEPLLGHADPIGFAGDMLEKPGMAHIAPGETLKLSVTITPELLPA
ncbi:aldose 1-epimerase family protein [Rhizobium sp. XQZ8]|uniref:aldose 1-epimerase family protein n=1 Tax=Rhizobium populisoli TaxID=2859785 RepID=UPI001CA59BFD|nr:aldose 1-epimerase family protein [Rhizobium populisoli]MBW6424352.1 aldose 1-epimerase family protein [Rhizobium populisoli]